MKIIYLWKDNTSFEAADYKLLSDLYDVSRFKFNGRNFYSFIKQVYHADLLFFWFPGDYKLLLLLIAKILSCQVVCVGGGQMATADSKAAMKYAGVSYRFGYILCAKLCIYLADRIIAVSAYEFKSLCRYTQISKIDLIYNLIDTDRISLEGQINNRTLDFVTVSTIDNEYVIRKGLDTYAGLASALDKNSFALIGQNRDVDCLNDLIAQSNGRLKYLGRLSDKELTKHVSRSKFYCQFSRQEGFGVALAEAMALGCTPIVSSMGAVREVAGPCAIYIDESRNYSRIRSCIEENFTDRMESDYYSKRVLELFSKENRINGIVNCLSSVFHELQ